ncbi:hypothetical protein BH09MYX1_BH09MYX1_17970 [soil metagenome]
MFAIGVTTAESYAFGWEEADGSVTLAELRWVTTSFVPVAGLTFRLTGDDLDVIEYEIDA